MKLHQHFVSSLSYVGYCCMISVNFRSEVSQILRHFPRIQGNASILPRKTRLAFMRMKKWHSRTTRKGVSDGVTNLVPTRSRKLEIHPMSIISGYRIDAVWRALQFIGARSLIAATRLFCRTSSFRYRTSISILASSSPLTELLTSWNRTRCI